jgi:predicted PurR-regulated permease PerM
MHSRMRQSKVMDVSETPVQASRPDRSGEEVIQIAIRLGLLAFLIYWTVVLLRPFIPVLAWSVVLSVALYPAFDWLSAHLGHRPRIAAAITTIVVLAVFLGPATWLGIGLVDGLRGISDQLTSGDLGIPSPPDRVRDWPVIGVPLYDIWETASENLEAAFRQVAPHLSRWRGRSC